MTGQRDTCATLSRSSDLTERVESVATAMAAWAAGAAST